jgi:undecaprenyl-phosphate 4-deoxy-4-formamido-L-arabinose transferase
VNDGSLDRSAEVCLELAQKALFPVTFVDLSRNFGEHNAVMAGLHQAQGHFIIIMDDDLQNPLSEVLRLLEHAQTSGCDVVYTAYEEKKHAPWRNWGSRLTNHVADLLLDKPQGLYLCSFKCLTRFTVSKILSYQGPFPYLDGLIFQVSQRIDSIRVEHAERAEGRSGYGLRKLLRLWMSMFVNFSIMPLRLATFLGGSIAIVGLLAAVAVIIEALFFSTPSGWGSLMACLLVFSGIQLLMLGLMGEYLGRIYLTLNQKPQFIVRKLFRNSEDRCG